MYKYSQGRDSNSFFDLIGSSQENVRMCLLEKTVICRDKQLAKVHRFGSFCCDMSLIPEILVKAVTR